VQSEPTQGGFVPLPVEYALGLASPRVGPPGCCSSRSYRAS